MRFPKGSFSAQAYGLWDRAEVFLLEGARFKFVGFRLMVSIGRAL